MPAKSSAERFLASLEADAPPAGCSPPLEALWRSAKDQWDAAHALVQADSTADAAWVHAHLHRIEGDLSNASYWYRRAGRPDCGDPIAKERAAIAAALA